MAQRIGIYSGTFDPVHVGHLTFGNTTRQLCRLDQVIFIPEQSPRHKIAVTDMRHRLAMLERALEPHPKLAATSLTTPRFTIAETLPELRKQFPNAQLTFLIGSDAAHSLLYGWEGLEQLLPDVHFAIGLRGADTAKGIHKIMRQVAFIYQNQAHYTIVPLVNVLHASSSGARKGDKATLLPEVEAYIQQNDLYR